MKSDCWLSLWLSPFNKQNKAINFDAKITYVAGDKGELRKTKINIISKQRNKQANKQTKKRRKLLLRILSFNVLTIRITLLYNRIIEIDFSVRRFRVVLGFILARGDLLRARIG